MTDTTEEDMMNVIDRLRRANPVALVMTAAFVTSLALFLALIVVPGVF